jgi:uncharacterized protein
MNMREPVDSLGEVTVVTAAGVTMTVADVRESARFEARVGDGLVGYITYRQHAGSGAMVVVHTVTEPAWRGHGVATAMTSAVLGLVQRAGRSVVPRCPFVAEFIAQHREFLDLVPEQHRHLIEPASPVPPTTPAPDYHSGD